MLDEAAHSSMEATQTAVDTNHLGEIEDLRVERMQENAFKQIKHKQLLKIIILGDTGKHFFPLHYSHSSTYHTSLRVS